MLKHLKFFEVSNDLKLISFQCNKECYDHISGLKWNNQKKLFAYLICSLVNHSLYLQRIKNNNINSSAEISHTNFDLVANSASDIKEYLVFEKLLLKEEAEYNHEKSKKHLNHCAKYSFPLNHSLVVTYTFKEPNRTSIIANFIKNYNKKIKTIDIKSPIHDENTFFDYDSYNSMPIKFHDKFNDELKKLELKFHLLGSGWYKQDNYGNRIYTVYSSAPSELRKFFKIKNDNNIEEYREIDLSNATVVNLIKLLDDNKLLTKKTAKDISEGKFYENILELFNANRTYLKFNRDHIKLLVMNFLFGKFYNEITYNFENVLTDEDSYEMHSYCNTNSKKFSFEFIEILRINYPDILEYSIKYKLDDHHNLSKNLFRMETELVRHTIIPIFKDLVKKITEEAPNLFTVHDCVMTNAKYINILAEAFKLGIDSYYGAGNVSCSYKIK